MAELDYAVLADFARVDGDGTLTVVGGHRAVVVPPALPAQQVLSVAGRLWMGRREPAAQLSLGALTPEGEIPVVAQWMLEPGAEQNEGTGRWSASFAVTVVFSCSIVTSAPLRFDSTRERSASYAFGSRYLNASSSSSFLILLIPSRLAIGA